MSIGSAARNAGSRLSALIAFFAVAAIAGTLVACVITPAVAITGTTADKAIDAFQALPSSLDITPLDQKTRIYAYNGKKPVLLASFFNQNRDVISWDQVPQTVRNAAIAGEDIRFYQHGPIDPNGVARAVVSNLLHKNIQGASTITQQYVKNVCVQQAEAIVDAAKSKTAYHACIEVSTSRKLREMRLAIGLEKKYSKDQILLGYLNIAGFGGRVYGIEAASQYYYDNPAKDLTIGQAAALLAIVNNPDNLRLDEKQNLAATQKRRHYILSQELGHGMITQADFDTADKAPIAADLKITQPSTGCQTAGSAGFFCQFVVNTILSSNEFGDSYSTRLANLNTKGWKVYTTLNLGLQNKAQKAIDYYVPQTPAKGGADVGAASVSLQVGTGRILTMVQNKTYSPAGKNRTRYSSINYNADQALGAGAGFQPGSTFKAFTMIGWLKSGHSMNQTVNGNARKIPESNFTACGKTYGYGTWDLHNDENEKGNFSVQEGTARSINGVFASLAEEQDLCDLRDISYSMGVVDGLTGKAVQVKPTMAIGVASSVAPLNNAVGYSTIANQGIRCDAIAIDKVVDPQGHKVATPSADCRRVQDQQLMIAAGYDLRNPVLSGTMSMDQLGDGRYMFGKTGTTDNAKDTWTMGSTTKVTTAVWVGNVTGRANLRYITSPQGCNAGHTYAVMRHCIFQAIQRTMNNSYGGASAWPYPESQYVTGGATILHSDAQPKSASQPKPHKDDKGDTSPTPSPTDGGGGGGNGQGNGQGDGNGGGGNGQGNGQGDGNGGQPAQ